MHEKTMGEPLQPHYKCYLQLWPSDSSLDKTFLHYLAAEEKQVAGHTFYN